MTDLLWLIVELFVLFRLAWWVANRIVRGPRYRTFMHRPTLEVRVDPVWGRTIVERPAFPAKEKRW